MNELSLKLGPISFLGTGPRGQNSVFFVPNIYLYKGGAYSTRMQTSVLGLVYCVPVLSPKDPEVQYLRTW